MRRIIAALAVVAVVLLVLIVTVNRPPDALPAGTRADRVLVSKSAHSLTLFVGNRPFKTYKVALGRGPGNAKHREGDHETPEGLYAIDAQNPHSRFHRALHVSYPNTRDRENAKAQGVLPGGDIMVHGVGRGLGWLGTLQHHLDWTDGCIALTNPEMDQLWELVPVGTPIEIRH